MLLITGTYRTKSGLLVPTYVTEEDIAMFKEAQDKTQTDLFKVIFFVTIKSKS